MYYREEEKSTALIVLFFGLMAACIGSGFSAHMIYSNLGAMNVGGFMSGMASDLVGLAKDLCIICIATGVGCFGIIAWMIYKAFSLR